MYDRYSDNSKRGFDRSVDRWIDRMMDRMMEYVKLFFIFAIPITFAFGYTYLRIKQYEACNEGKMGACIAFYKH